MFAIWDPLDGMPVIEIVATFRTNNLLCEGPVWSMQIRKFYSRLVSSGASQPSPKPTVKIERQQWKKTYTGNAAEGADHECPVSGCSVRQLTNPCVSCTLIFE